MVNENIRREAQYIIENKTTIEETYKRFGISRKTIYNHFEKLKNSEDIIDKDLYDKLNRQLRQNELEGKIKGGTSTNSGKQSNLDIDTIKKIAIIIISNDLSLRDAEKYFNIPKSTLYEMLTKGLIDKENKQLLNDLKAHFEKNKIHRDIKFQTQNSDKMYFGYQEKANEIFENDGTLNIHKR